ITAPTKRSSARRRVCAFLALVWLTALLAFIALAIRASTADVLSVDVSIARRVQALPGWLGVWFDFENWLGATVPLAAVTFVAAAALSRRGQKLEALVMLATFLPRIGDTLVKKLVAEPRPSSSLIHVQFPHDN